MTRSNELLSNGNAVWSLSGTNSATAIIPKCRVTIDRKSLGKIATDERKLCSECGSDHAKVRRVLASPIEDAPALRQKFAVWRKLRA